MLVMGTKRCGRNKIKEASDTMVPGMDANKSGIMTIGL